MTKKSSEQIWASIACTDDEQLRRDFEKLITKNYSLREWQEYKDEDGGKK